MARGAIAKQEIMSKILSSFEGSFMNDKEIRIPLLENGEEVQIKVTLTCAKENIGAGMSAAMPAEVKNDTEVSPEVKQEVSELFASLNLI